MGEGKPSSSYVYDDEAILAAQHAMTLFKESSSWSDVAVSKEKGAAFYREASVLERNITYLAMPRAMAEAYQLKTTKEFPGDGLTLGLLQLYQFIMTFDHGMDDSSPSSLLQAFRMYRHAVPQILGALPSHAHAEVNRQLDNCLLRTFTALNEERCGIDNPTMDKSHFEKIAIGKASLSHLVPSLIAIRSGIGEESKHVVRLQISALDHMHIGMQLIDDIQDVSRDLASGQPTWPLLLLEKWCRDNSIVIRELPFETVRKLIYTTGIALRCIEDATHNFKLANEAIASLHMPIFKGILRTLIDAQISNACVVKRLLSAVRSVA